MAVASVVIDRASATAAGTATLTAFSAKAVVFAAGCGSYSDLLLSLLLLPLALPLLVPLQRKHHSQIMFKSVLVLLPLVLLHWLSAVSGR